MSHDTIPCPPPDHVTADRFLAQPRVLTMSVRAALAVLTFGEADAFPATTNHKTTIGTPITEETGNE